jgi:hypothetical protein
MRNKCVFSGIFRVFTTLPIFLLLAGLALFVALPASRAAQITLVPLNSDWKYFIGNSEASTPTSAWRVTNFNDTAWSSGPAPIGYGETGLGTTVPDARFQAPPSYLSVFLRKTFVLNNDPATIQQLDLSVDVDDGAVAWINGIEVGRINVPDGELAYNAAASVADERRVLTVTTDPKTLGLLRPGTNVLAIHLFNGNTNSSDLYFHSTLTITEDTDAPTIQAMFPLPNSTNRTLTSVEVLFSELVTGVTAGDLLINGSPATAVIPGEPNEYIFSFPQPPAGTVGVSWASGHGIADPAGHPFVATPPWTYVVDPTIGTDMPLLNEFMADNDDTLNDEDGDSSDWIEIHNPGVATLDLGGWMLRDSSMTWRFPAGASVPANGYLVVFASGKNKTNLLGRLHTNFGLSQNGEYLGLLDPMTNVVSEFAPYPGGQLTDVSYGRDAGDPNLKGFFTIPTPGARNQSGGPGFAPDVQFSRPSGTFVSTSPFNLTLSTPATNAVIRYAFGTNMPGPTSLAYSGSILVSTTTLIRARAFVPGLLPGPISTKQYISLTNDASVLNFSSHLPIMIVHNYGQGPIPNQDKNDRFMIMQMFEPGFTPSSMTNRPTTAEFGIYHPRGSSTLDYAKESWFMEIQDEFRDGKNVPMLGLPEESDWIFYAPNNFEPALFHNPLAMQLARDQGEYASRTRFVEVYYKDDLSPGPITAADYNGIYVMMEKIKRDDNRVNIANLEREHRTLPEISGGYMWSIDRSNGEPAPPLGVGSVNWVDPSGFEMTNAARIPQMNYVRNYFSNLNATLANNTTWTNPVTGYPALIDVDTWVTRHVHEVLTFNVDALRLSGYFFKDRNKKLAYGPAWDYDRTQGSTDGRDFNPRTFRSQVGDLGTDFFNFLPWWGRLFQAPDFWQAWIDKYQELRDGPLSTNNIFARIDGFYNELKDVQPRERTRWGIITRQANGTGSGTYETEVQWKKNWYSNRLDYIDSQFLPRPILSLAGGQQTNGSSLTITPPAKPGSWVVYTLNGVDPRASGGAFTPGALSNSGPVTITISNNVRVFARSWNATHVNVTGANNPPISSRWSGPATGTYYTAVPPLRITEIMYHPQSPPSGTFGDEEFEYIEVRNIGATPLNVQGYRLKGGVDFTFPNLTLTAGQRVMVVHNRAAFQQRYGPGPVVAGEYTNVLSSVDGTRETNSLDNAGERLVLEGPLREPILDFEYDDAWYPVTDGLGFSLVIIDDQASPATWGLQSSWRASGELDGSPGTPGTERSFPPVVINEVLTHSDPPPPTDTIELLNLSGADANIGGWFLTDDFQEPKKYRILDGTTVPANGFILFNEGHFNAGPNPFSLSSLGEEVYLFSGDGTNLTGYVHGFDFGPAENGRTFGRYIISTGTDQYPRQLTPTLGAPNSGPIVGPIVISEINYRPVDLFFGGRAVDNDLDEYIELHNITGGTVQFYDPAHPTNTWQVRNAVDFDFPTNVSIGAGGFLLLVNFDPADPQKLAAFRTRHSISGSIPIYGPYGGQLDNGGEAIELRRPDVPEPDGPPNFGLVPYVLVERVRYSDQAPWPAAADGIGPTLQRINVAAYGNDPGNWVAAARTAGAPYGGGASPIITQQPTNQTAIAGNAATLSVSATGANLSYQWRFNGQILPGATSSTLMFSSVQPNDQGNYDVAVLNPSGAVVSSNAFLTVLIPAAITLQPTNLVYRNGSTNLATFGQTTNDAVFTMLVASSRPVSYQWRSNGVAIQNVAGLIHGVTSNTLTISNVNLSHNGTYQCFAADAISSVQSDPVTLTVAVPPFVLNPDFYGRHVQPVTALAGEDVTFSVVHGGTPPFAYRWQSNSVGLVTNYTTTVFATNEGVPTYFASFTVANVQTAAVTRTYRVVITNAANPSPGLLSAAGTGIPTGILTVLADTDGDKAADLWETQNGFDPNNSSDGSLDADNDGMNNAAEFRAGTDPRNAASYLKVDQFSVAGQASLTFLAVSNKNYTVEFSDSLEGGPWSWLTDVSAVVTNRTVTIRDTNPVAPRYYRLVTPVQQ